MNKNYGSWEPVIGLEIHVQLNTKTKLFSSAPNSFGSEPNTNITVVCTGQPGSLPVLNKAAIDKAVLFGLAVDADIQTYSRFDRKSYFYPDSPRNFQITQFEKPIIIGGKVRVQIEGKEVIFEIDRAHLEDDAGMLKHFSNFAGVDYNRAGVPLVEIVSKPIMHTPKEASSYAMAIKSILEYVGASDCNMEKGHLRMDANISVRKKGEDFLRNKIEIKNMNSFNFLEIAIENEINRQIDIYTKNPDADFKTLIPSVTYRFDPSTKSNIVMRTKESADDYRYFPEPDVPPIILTKKYLDEIKTRLPELPYDRFQRYINDYNMSEYNAHLLIHEKKIADYFERALEHTTNAKSLCNWMTVEFAGRLKEKGLHLQSLDIPPKHLGCLVNMIDSKIITGKIAKKIADEMIDHPELDPEELVKSNPNYQPLTDEHTIKNIVLEILANNPQSIEDYKNGKDKAFAFLVGQVMKQTKGKASPEIVNKLIKENI